MVISILGCGWYGKALAKALIDSGHHIKGSATSADKLDTLSAIGITPYVTDFKADSETYDADFFKCDVLIISIPPKTRQGEGGDYLQKLKRIVNTAEKHSVDSIIYISSTAVYPENCGEVTEADAPEPDTEPGKILLEAEKLFYNKAIHATVLRFGGLVGPGRHPGRFFAGKFDIPNGRAPVNLVHLDDCIGITLAIIQKPGSCFVINAVSPHHPEKAGFYKKATLQAGFAAPEFIDELKGWKIVNSNLLPGILNYRFRVDNWDECSFS